MIYSHAAVALLERANTELVCVDAGSAGGLHPRMQAIRRRAQLIGLDADAEECARLNAAAGPAERQVHAAVGRPGEEVVLELHRKRQTSSCFETDLRRVAKYEDAGRYGADGQVRMTTRGLNEICVAEGIPRVDFLKVDVEGLELAVLEGFSGECLAAEMEANFHPFLERNYGLLDTPQASARYLALLCVYGYAPEALMAVEALSESHVMPQDESSVVAELIQRHSGRSGPVGPRLPIRRLLALVEQLVRLTLAIGSGLWMNRFYQADGPLGN